MELQDLYKLLQHCTVRIDSSTGQGTGFFVSPMLILTCAHVVEALDQKKISIFWKESQQHYTAQVVRLIADPKIDLAILRLNIEKLDHPCVYFDKLAPKLNDRLYCFGYPRGYPDGDSATFEYEGESFKGSSQLHKLKEGQADYGLSGSPLLNQRTQSVCGIVNISRSTSSDLGARAVATSAILSEIPNLIHENQNFHKKDIRWRKLQRHPERNAVWATLATLCVFISLLVGNLVINQGAFAFDVSVSNKTPDYAVANEMTVPEAPETTLSYQVDKSTNGQIQITPKMEYLENIENGQPILGLDIWGGFPYFKWRFPNLDLRAVNNTNKTIYITDIVLEVEKSVVDPSVVLVIPEEPSNLLHFELVNEGWGEVQNGLVKFDIVPHGSEIQFDGSYQHELPLGEFSDTYNGYSHNVDTSEALRKAGVDIDQLGYTIDEEGFISIDWLWEQCYSQIFGDEQINEFCQSKIDAIGVFGKGRNPENDSLYSAVMYGEILFEEDLIEGGIKKRAVKFKTLIPLIDGGQYGAPGPPTYQYEAKLELNKENYQVSVQADGSSVSQFLQAGETDRFNILIGADKSSVHTFRLRLIYNSGKNVLSPPITLEIFVPRSEADEVKRLSTLISDESKYLAERETIDNIVDIQKKLIQDGRTLEAISVFDQAQQINPQLEISAQAWGEICTLDNLWLSANEAMKACEKAIELEPINPIFHHNIAVAYAVKDDIDNATASFQNCFDLVDSIQPTNNDQRVNLEAFKSYLEGWLDDLRSGENPTTARVVMWRGIQLAEKGEILEAIEKLSEAQSIDPELEILPEHWNIVCWNGSLSDQATEVMSICEKTVELSLESQKGLYRDSRGLARALVGQTEGAVEDFEAFIDWIEISIENNDQVSWEQKRQFEKIKAKRLDWLNQLRNNTNPFTNEELENLYDE